MLKYLRFCIPQPETEHQVPGWYADSDVGMQIGWATSPNRTPLPLTVASLTKAISKPFLVAEQENRLLK